MSESQTPVKTLQQLALRLIDYWVERGCVWSQPYDAPMGAGTFHPHTFLRGIGPEPWRSVYVQPCRRPVDGRYGESPYRFQHYYQLQVLLKPAPSDIVDVFLGSLECVGIRLKEHDVGLLEDDWKGPTLGAWGLGWEVRANGQEITQFTYFQQLGGMDVDVVCGEITYGLERLFMYATGSKDGMEIPYNERFTYGDVFKQNEFEFSHFNFKQADIDELLRGFAKCEAEVERLTGLGLVLPAYDSVLTASHFFNLLDARGALSAGERQRYIGRVRDCARSCAVLYRSEREKLGFPMMSRLPSDGRLPISVNSEAPVKKAEMTRPPEPATVSGPETLLIEFGTEELPPSFQQAATKAASELESLREGLIGASSDEAYKALLNASKLQFLVTQRRLVLMWKDLPAYSPSAEKEIWGPAEAIAMKEGRLSPAGEGFCRKNGLSPDSVEFREKGGSRFLYAKRQEPPVYLPSVVLERFEDWLLRLPSPLKMRWLPADVAEPFVRPVRWILAMHGQTEVSFPAASQGHGRFGLVPGRRTCGQRIASPEWTELGHASDYVGWLGERGIELQLAERRRRIRKDAQRVLDEVHGTEGILRCVADDGLLTKVGGLAETPYVFAGSFSDTHLRLPRELVISVLRDHMNAFAVEDESGQLVARFVGVANYKPGDVPGMVSAAERVVEGRLADGTFYFDGDLATPIDSLQVRLGRQVFQDGLGSLADKQNRMATLVSHFAGDGGLEDELGSLVFAAKHSKVDLQTGCVTEFPDEMQGVMGEHLVRAHGLALGGAPGDLEGAARAVGEQYRPASADDHLPSTVLGCALALSDKWDTVVSLLLRGDRVKGNKDPFGLRRNTLSVLRLCGAFGEKGTVVVTPQSLMKAAGLVFDAHPGVGDRNKARQEIVDFVTARLEAGWRDALAVGAAVAVSRMVKRSLQAGESRDFGTDLSFSQAYVLAQTLDKALADEASPLQPALAAYKRARNIVLKAKGDAAPKEGTRPASVDPGLFESDAENGLHVKCKAIEGLMPALLAKLDFEGYLEKLSELEGPLQTFFDGVMVNVDDASLRSNRIALLQGVLDLYESYADFSCV